MEIKSKINFDDISNFKNFTRIFSFNNNCYNIDIKFLNYFVIILNTAKKYIIITYKIKKLIGCFGVCYVIDYTFLKSVDNKYNISNLVKIINNRDKRKTLERFLIMSLKKESESKLRPHLIGNIFDNLKKQSDNKNVLIKKIFYGR